MERDVPGSPWVHSQLYLVKIESFKKHGLDQPNCLFKRTIETILKCQRIMDFTESKLIKNNQKGVVLVSFCKLQDGECALPAVLI